MITTNYAVSNNQPSFGTYCFHDGAKALLKRKIKSPKDVERFETICRAESSGYRQERVISVSASIKNGSYSGDKLTANTGDGWHTQKFYQSIFSFLENMSEKADKVQKQINAQKKVDEIIGSILN